MSRLIDVDKAFKAVKDCCAEINPGSKLKNEVSSLIQKIVQNLPLPPALLEAGTGLGTMPGSAVATAGKVVGSLTKGARGRALVLAGPKPDETMNEPITKAKLYEFVDRLRDIEKKMEQTDICSAMAGCVAKKFRTLQLPQGSGKRTKYVARGWVEHYIKPGGHIPKKQQRLARP